MNASERKEYFYRFCRAVLHIGLRLYNRLEIHGGEMLPLEGGCVVATNHASVLDPPIISAGARHRVVRYMARDTLFKGVLGWILRNACVMPLSRDRGDVGAMRKSIELLKKGHCVGLFPEGTRTPDGQLQPAKGGIGFLLAKANVPVVPAYIHGTFEAFPKGASFIKPAKVSIHFGAPITAAEIAAMGSDRAAYEGLSQLIMSRIESLRGERCCK